MTKTPPYYAVIFTSKHSNVTDGYNEMTQQMETLAKQQKGFLGITSARDHIGITVSYWERLDDITNWKQQSDHFIAQKKGKSTWYDWYDVKICKVERAYNFNAPETTV
ncbi:antibiotic biosynthesis monooxygenase family protein [Mariniflexile sp. AS56]|uniref:antibiotic biosynthesis monooxygenase family protein n=1 Tax=Mariniflexile sp. AS56 TaxID=3063957 RepID=UPI0026F20351|nr:antibiotic biosynthesis monooxygenase [Mariniflexile sp. AS56]MDO7172017.1 antibiotic biosynthesis monooxygenase [Mariniflexile sp. AS56]